MKRCYDFYFIFKKIDIIYSYPNLFMDGWSHNLNYNKKNLKKHRMGYKLIFYIPPRGFDLSLDWGANQQSEHIHGWKIGQKIVGETAKPPSNLVEVTKLAHKGQLVELK